MTVSTPALNLLADVLRQYRNERDSLAQTLRWPSGAPVVAYLGKGEDLHRSGLRIQDRQSHSLPLRARGDNAARGDGADFGRGDRGRAEEGVRDHRRYVAAHRPGQHELGPEVARRCSRPALDSARDQFGSARLLSSERGIPPRSSGQFGGTQ